jgi:2-haloacid dehalogenase
MRRKRRWVRDVRAASPLRSVARRNSGRSLDCATSCKLSGFVVTIDPSRACVFDAYGTLFDVHSAVTRNAEAVGKNSAEVSKLWRTKQLEYSWVHTLMRRHVHFWELTSAALEYALAFYDVHHEGVKRTLLGSYLSLDAYPEVPAVLQKLRASGLKTAVLSNGSPVMLDRAIRSAGLLDLLDKCLSIEDAQKYKPDPSAYQIATASLSVQPSEVAFFFIERLGCSRSAYFRFPAVLGESVEAT